MQVYPATLQYFHKGTANIFSIFWFATLVTLGVDSLFAIVEGITTLLADIARLQSVKKETIALYVCICGFMGSVIYVSEIGRYFLDVVDHYTLSYVLILVGAAEAYVIAWVWGWFSCEPRIGALCAPRPFLHACMHCACTCLAPFVDIVDRPRSQLE